MPTKQEYEDVIKAVLKELEVLVTKYENKMILFRADKLPYGAGRELRILKSKISALEISITKTLAAYKTSIEQSIDDKDPEAKEKRRLACAEGGLVLAKEQLSLTDASSAAAAKVLRGHINNPIQAEIWQSCSLRRVDAAESLREAKIELTAAKEALDSKHNQKQSAQPQNALSQSITTSIQKDARQQMRALRKSQTESQDDDSKEISSIRRSGME